MDTDIAPTIQSLAREYKLFCLIQDDKSPFPIEIQDTETISDLKDTIKEKSAPEFDHIAAYTLQLYQLDRPHDVALPLRDGAEGLTLLNSTFQLKDIYPAGPPKRTIHILVKPPTRDSDHTGRALFTEDMDVRRLASGTSKVTIHDYLLPSNNNHECTKLPSVLACLYAEGQAQTSPFATCNLNRPCRVKVVLNLSEVMKANLDEILESGAFKVKARAPAPASVVSSYATLVDHCGQYTPPNVLNDERQVQDLGCSIINVVQSLYKGLTGEPLLSKPKHCTIDGEIVMERTFYRNEKVILILIEYKRPRVGRCIMDALKKRLVARQEPFAHDTGQEWVKEDTILATVAWAATQEQDSKKRPIWTLIYDGVQYLAIRPVYENTMAEKTQVSLLVSDIMDAHDPKFPIIAALVYAALESDLQPPEQPRPQQQQDRRGGDSLGRVGGITIQAPKCESVSMTRVTRLDRGLSPARMRLQQDIPTWPLLLLTDMVPFALGAIGDVYRTTASHVVKYSHRNQYARDTLLGEAKVYLRLQQAQVAGIPHYLGVFASRYDFILLLSDEGQPVKSFSDLSQEDRDSLLQTLVKIHAAGVLHEDFEARNVVLGPKGPAIVDFSHSTLSHRCLGLEGCTELQEAERQLNKMHFEWQLRRRWPGA